MRTFGLARSDLDFVPLCLFFSLPHIFIRSPRRSLTAHASSDYWDQTGESTHTHTLRHAHTSSSFHIHYTHTHTLRSLLISSLMSYHWRRADCRDPDQDRGLTLPRYTHCSLATATRNSASFCRDSRDHWSGALRLSVWEEERVCGGKFSNILGYFTC